MKPLVIGIDPGTEQSAYVAFDGERVTMHDMAANISLVGMLRGLRPESVTAIVFEQIENMGMPAGRETFETVFWTGRLFQVATSVVGISKVERLPRRAVKLHLCGSMKAKDPNIRQALIDRFGGSKAAAVGVKSQKGPLYGISKHEWAALAVSVTWFDQCTGPTRVQAVRPTQAGGRVRVEAGQSARRSLPNV